MRTPVSVTDLDRENFGRKGPPIGYPQDSASEYGDSEVDSEGEVVRTPSAPGSPIDIEPSTEPLLLHPVPSPSGPPTTAVDTTQNQNVIELSEVQEITANLSEVTVNPSENSVKAPTREPRPILKVRLGVKKTKRNILPIPDHNAKRIERISLDRRQARSRHRSKLCRVCNIKVNSGNFLDHVRGKKHKKALDREEDKKNELNCGLCKKEFHSRHDYLRHINGKDHEINLIIERNSRNENSQ